MDSYFIPSGTIVGISTYALHHNSKHWREPEKFVPERWVEGSEYGKQDDRDAFRPFSAGTRACIGTNLAYLEMRIVLARLVWEFDWEGDGGGNDWLDKCRAIALWKRPSVMVGFKKRNT